MKEIELTRGLKTQIDNKNYDFLNKWKWYANKSHNTYYAERIEIVNGKRICISMHRIIMNTPNYLQCDHEDRNGLNN